MTSNNTYPAPKPRRVKQPKLTVINYERQPEFGNTLEEWEERIFRAAAFFGVVRYGVPAGSECVTVDSYPKALHLAYGQDRYLVYAVTLAGRAFCIPRSEYQKYARIWLSMTDRQPSGGVSC